MKYKKMNYEASVKQYANKERGTQIRETKYQTQKSKL